MRKDAIAALVLLVASEDPRLYLEPERLAKHERRGLWRDNDPEPPSQWRRAAREHRPHGG